MELINEVKAWIKRKNGPDEIVRVIPAIETNSPVKSYQLYVAYEQDPEYLGQILFDAQGYWIYDGGQLTIAEQEQVARFIINYAESL